MAQSRIVRRECSPKHERTVMVYATSPVRPSTPSSALVFSLSPSPFPRPIVEVGASAGRRPDELDGLRGPLDRRQVPDGEDCAREGQPNVAAVRRRHDRAAYWRGPAATAGAAMVWPRRPGLGRAHASASRATEPTPSSCAWLERLAVCEVAVEGTSGRGKAERPRRHWHPDPAGKYVFISFPSILAS